MSEAINPKAAAVTSFCADILITFAEGGWGSWYRIHEYKWADEAALLDARKSALECADPAGTFVVISNIEADTKAERRKCHKLTPVEIEAAIKKLVDPAVSSKELALHKSYRATVFHAYSECLSGDEFAAGDIDAELADYIVQVAIFGSVIFS